MGGPPFSVDPPERVAEGVLLVVDRPQARRQVGRANGLLRVGSKVLPKVYDALVAPLFGVAAVDRTDIRGPHDGNVLESQPADNRLRGNQGPSLLSLARNLPAVWQDR